ncbi:MAG: hypothetical protein HRT41_09065 [Campylobacteraceae bacterium]|nr:hypothetical protein [Campylobacteraceae bacterium]
MNKKSYILLLSIFLLAVFSYVSLDILKNINLKQENQSKTILYQQAKLHLNFLEEYIKKYPIKESMSIENDLFEIYAFKKDIKTDLFVKYKQEGFFISLHKELLEQ